MLGGVSEAERAVAVMILRIDDVVVARKSEGNSGKAGGMMGYD